MNHLPPGNQKINPEYLYELKYYADRWGITFMELLKGIKKIKSTSIDKLEEYFIHETLVKGRW